MNDPAHRPESDLDALFALARTRRPGISAAEYAFETRLMAGLRAEREMDSIWATAFWRMVPVFAACVAALAIWQSQLATETNDATAIVSLDNPESVDLGSSLN